MPIKYSDEFKQQAVQKILNKHDDVTMEDIAAELGSSFHNLSVDDKLPASQPHWIR
ncbi:transposase [Colwellia sp. MB02u-6]|uniref:transposase n=1 Tax=Colwellia sp. MB02u-6 TaxID=2759824 RepID=UPI0015F39631|nr:transposase [Colwellia sp. MB02u-6]MBA6329564.1 transposase [Colwellia sp. MB02u-6]